jgi:two-component system, OmpR family, sensor histidine kinase BaeS
MPASQRSRYRGGPPRGQEGRPPWWPENEPWPPERPPWQVNRRGILIRVIVLFVLFVLLVGFAGWLTYHIMGQGGEPDWQRGEGRPPIGPFIGLILIVGIIVLITRRIQATVRPVVQVMEATSRVAQGDYGARVEPAGPRDVQKMMLAFNEMTSQLEANERERRRLFADIAHELRTPLAVIQGNIEGMMDGIYPRDDAHMAPLLDQTKVITRLLGDLQTMASTETGSLHLYREDTDLCDVINDVVAAFSPAATRDGISLVAESPAEPVPGMEVDPVRIRQVLENLVSNALRYTSDSGTVRITASPARDAVRVAVADTGRGMTQEDADRMFERFVKSADSGGSGLGLAIAKGLVEAHGGTISATSSPGEGTTVTFTLPIQPVQ